jgi:internalin A
MAASVGRAALAKPLRPGYYHLRHRLTYLSYRRDGMAMRWLFPLLIAALGTAVSADEPAAPAKPLDYRVVFRYRADGPTSIKDYEAEVRVYERKGDSSEKLVGTFTGSIFPDLNTRGRVKDGRYDLYLGLHRRSKDGKAQTPSKDDLVVKSQGYLRPALIVNADAAVPVECLNPKKKTSTYIHVHNGFRERRSSEGCLTLQPDDWARFITIFLDRYTDLADWHAAGKYYGRKVAVLEVEPAAPKNIDAKVIAAWKQAETLVGWHGPKKIGGVFYGAFYETMPKGVPVLPAFKVHNAEPGVLKKLPSPAVPFAIVLTTTGPWLGELAAFENLQTLDFSHAGAMDEHLREVGKLKSLKGLFVGGPRITDAGVKELAPLKSLQMLNVSSTQVGDAGLTALAGLTNLRVVNLRSTKISDDGLKVLAGFKNLERLNLSRNKVSTTGPLVALKHLEELNLDNTQVADLGLKGCAGLKSLKILSLHATQVTDAGLKEIAGLTNLQELHLTGLTISDTGLLELAAVAHMQDLSVSGTKITDAGLRELARHKELRRLWVNCPVVTDAGLQELAGLTNLQSLSVPDAQVTLMGLKKLAGLDLRDLDLSGTKVGDAELRELVAFKSLRSVTLYQTKLTDSGVAELRKLCPDLKIVR